MISKLIKFVPLKAEIKLSSSSSQSWVIGNIKHGGFYRVNYDDDNWKMLIDQLKTNHTIFDSLTKAQLIDDSFNLGRAEIIDQIKFLDVVSYLNKENDPLPFVPAITGLNYLEKMLVDRYETFEMFKA